MLDDDILNLRQCVNSYSGAFPAQCRGSGVIFYNGTKVTIEEFRKECRRQGFTFKVK